MSAALGGPLADTAREDFTAGLHVGGAVGAVIFLALAVGCALALRTPSPSPVPAH